MTGTGPPPPRVPAAPLRVANCSGFYGDRLSAAKEMVEGGPVDVLTGDWLAELTMLILAGNRLKGRPGYARTFLTQLEEVLGTCVDRGIKVVSNAGGLDPAGCAAAVTELADRLGLTVRVAHVKGDDLTGRDLGDMVNLDTGERLGATPLTANAYLGGEPIAAALENGADVVVTGRVTDAALVTGPGMWRYGWRPEDLDALAGSVVAGHVIECGCQATGGNYAFFAEVPGLAHCGFPIAELYADGSSVITKHPGTGGLVSVGTVTAQLLYEIGSPRYLGPDVTARFDTIELTQAGDDRVRVSGVRGEPPPETLKVALNHLGGYRNTMTLVLTGLDIEAKARLAEEAIFARVPRDSFDQVHVELTPLAAPGGAGAPMSGGSAADSGPTGQRPRAETGPTGTWRTAGGTALLRVTVMDADRRRAGRAFSSAVVETGLASYPGFYGLTPPGDASAYGIYWPATIPRSAVQPETWLDGEPVHRRIDPLARRTTPDHDPTPTQTDNHHPTSAPDQDPTPTPPTRNQRPLESNNRHPTSTPDQANLPNPGDAPDQAHPSTRGTTPGHTNPSDQVPTPAQTDKPGQTSTPDQANLPNPGDAPDQVNPSAHPNQDPAPIRTDDRGLAGGAVQVGLLGGGAAPGREDLPRQGDISRPGTPHGQMCSTSEAGTLAPGGAEKRLGEPSAERVPLGVVAGARSGDKGGNANLGVWVRTAAEYAWLDWYLTVDRLRDLLPGTAPLKIERHRLPNLLALNFVVHGLLGRGVAASPRMDAQAKALGEELRACLVPIPGSLLGPKDQAT